MAKLAIRELFRSIQGESTYAGWPCTFVRMAGCDIRCVYCDEPEALVANGAMRLSVDEVLLRVKELSTPMVEVTGGEPLVQREVPELVRRLCDQGYEVLVETGGHHDITPLDPRCHIILDVKTPGSGTSATNDLQNLDRLRPGDEVKFVLTDRADYEWARGLVRERELNSRAPVHFSPSVGVLDAAELAGWILDDGLRVRLNLQIHKWVWGETTRGV